jgi:hypothetical protein
MATGVDESLGGAELQLQRAQRELKADRWRSFRLGDNTRTKHDGGLNRLLKNRFLVK